jgi:nitrous oxidase accessory protein
MRTVAFTVLFSLLSGISFGSIIKVDKKSSIKSIKHALRIAKDFDTVIVNYGIYKEGNITIKKPVTLIGKQQPILDGDHKFEVISVRSDNVIIKGFHIQHSSYAVLDDPGGIKIYESRDIQILDNVLYDNFFGIYVQFCRQVLIKGNKVISSKKREQEIGNGIHCWKSDSLQIIANDVSGNRDGIYFEFVEHSIIWRNISHDNLRYGLHFMFSHDDAYITNVFRNNGAGVAVMFTKHVVMMNNLFDKNWGDAAYGLLLKELTDCYMHGNKFTDNTTAVFMDGSTRIEMESNLFKSNGWGLKMQSNCLDNKINQNNFIANTFDVATSGNTTLSTFNQNYWDKYEGYDLNKDGIGDVSYHPLSLFSSIVEANPPAMLLYRSFMVTLLDKSEKIIPSITPADYVDDQPMMHSYKI